MSESVDTSAAEKVAPTMTDPSQDAIEQEQEQEQETFIQLLEKLPKPLRKALNAALAAPPGERYQAAIGILSAHYDDPVNAALECVKTAAFIADSGTQNDEYQLLTMYRNLPPRECERVWNFTSDARQRGRDEKAAHERDVIEDFESFLFEARIGTADAEVQQLLDITPEQHQRYKAAWQTLQDVYGEREAGRQVMRGGGDTGT